MSEVVERGPSGPLPVLNIAPAGAEKSVPGSIVTPVPAERTLKVANAGELCFTSVMVEQLKALIRDIPDFPKKGIVFRDITPLLADPAALALSIELMSNRYRGKRVDVVVGAESRGFIFGTAIACAISAGFVPVRKPGKLPSSTVSCSYALEYGTDSLHMHSDGVLRGQRVLLIDDLLATGGTLHACADMITRLGGEIVGISVLIELAGLRGRDKLTPHAVHSVIQY